VNLAEAAFAPLFGVPSWLVSKGHGSFITLEFGSPSLQIDEPRRMPLHITGAPTTALRRLAHVRGQWHLWIYCCDWSLLLHDVQLANNESDDITMNRALQVLNGQALVDVTINRHDAATKFTFDLGCVLETSPSPGHVYGVEPVEQWLLYQPDQNVLTVRSDGSYRLAPGDAAPEGAPWSPLG
jgi:hypothetical protein